MSYIAPSFTPPQGVSPSDFSVSSALVTAPGSSGSAISGDTITTGITKWGANSLEAAAAKDKDWTAYSDFANGNTAQGLADAYHNGDKDVISQAQYLESNGNLQSGPDGPVSQDLWNLLTQNGVPGGPPNSGGNAPTPSGGTNVEPVYGQGPDGTTISEPSNWV